MLGRLTAFLIAAASLACGAPAAADIVDVTLVNQSSSPDNDAPVTFGHVFVAGDVPAGSTIGAKLPGGTELPTQADIKTLYPDGSVRHAVITTRLSSIQGNGTQVVTLAARSAPGGSSVALADVLATSFDTVVSLNVGGTTYTASARDALEGSPTVWLSGPLVGEWIAKAPLRTSGGAAHPHLSARFNVRAYAGVDRVRVGVVVENAYSFVPSPQRYTYDVTVSIPGAGTVLDEDGVVHYRQSRWYRTFWWGTPSALEVQHDSGYMMSTRSVPTYQPGLQVPNSALNSMVSSFDNNNDLMDVGYLERYMPAAGGRLEIAPLPRFTARYIISGDLRAKYVTVGHGIQAGAWPMHYRDEKTDLPVSLDDYPTMTLLSSSGPFPSCGGNCSSPYTPEVAHHPSLAYVPYLVTGDHYLLEELQFWANWVMFYGPAYGHANAKGLVVWDQVRGQAWGLRTLAQAAYATPDDHPLKGYFNEKLQNNIQYFLDNWVDSNPLGYITNTGAARELNLERWISTWMDDFLTWSFGHMVALGFEEARPVLEWKAKFPVGRLSHPDMCWILASTDWPTVRDDVYLGGSGDFVDTWDEWRRAIIWSWEDYAFAPGTTRSIAGREQDLIDAECNSAEMANILGLPRGNMISYDGAQGYPANLQPAAAVAVEAGVPNAEIAFETLISATDYPGSEYNTSPQWAIFPASAAGPSVTFSANPLAVPEGGSTTLTWSASSGALCTASGGWAGSKAASGSQTIDSIQAATTFTLTCADGNGETRRSVQVTLAGTEPTLAFSASPTSVTAGGTSTLTWEATNVSSCTASGGWNGSRAVSGSQSVGPLASSTSFTLSCSGPSGNVSKTVDVSVGSTAAPTVSLTSSASSVAAGGSVELTWTSSNADSCVASGDWSGTKSPSGSESVGPLSSASQFVLACTNAGGTTTRSVSVTIAASGGNPPPSSGSPPGNGGGGDGDGDGNGGEADDGSGGGSADLFGLLFLLVANGYAAARRRAAVRGPSRA